MTGKFEDLLYDAVWHPAMQNSYKTINQSALIPNALNG